MLARFTYWVMTTSVYYAADGINETGASHSSLHKLTKLCEIIPAFFVVGLHALHPIKLSCKKTKQQHVSALFFCANTRQQLVRTSSPAIHFNSLYCELEQMISGSLPCQSKTRNPQKGYWYEYDHEYWWQQQKETKHQLTKVYFRIFWSAAIFLRTSTQEPVQLAKITRARGERVVW